MRDGAGQGSALEPWAWLTGLWPLLAVHAAHAISLNAGLVPACLPYVEGCTSISRAARQGDAILLFRAMMLPYVGLLALFWLLNARWCALLAPGRVKARRAMLGCGLVGAVFLALYATTLGVDGDFYRWLRRYGINLYFSLTVLAQMFLIAIASRAEVLGAGLRRAFLVLLALLLGLGLASLPLQFLLEGPARDARMNALEWQYALLMVLAYPLTGLAWRRTGFQAGFGIGKDSL
ncbi:hypothetical protein [Solimonas sp. K1W22B-7]|uniref:hypothetical protein n=1 Tax=Solimonas sp. K1W22B-7 TaxID=2303331 RepID=UPI0013C4D3D1|nr:hypothetical protein [Solimonas sp. K1W22B-7]